MGKSAPKTQTVVNETKLPAWVEQASQGNYNLATELSGRLPGAYQGNVVAGLDPMQPAFDYARGVVGSQAGNIGAAQSVAADAAGFTPQTVQPGSFLSGNVGAYMNPYVQNVEQAALTNMQDALAQNVNQIGDRAIAAKAFGGSRQGVMEGAAAAQGAKDFGALSAQLRSSAFDTAGGMMRSDMDRQLQAQLANQQADLSGNQQQIQAALAGGTLASSAQGMGYRDVAGLSAIGEQQRQYQQDLLAQDAARFDANRAAQLEPLNLRMSALGMSPYGSTQTQTRSGFQTGSSPLMQGLGAASSLASIYSGLGGAAGIGSGISSIGSALMAIPAMFSDEKMKTNKQLLGRDAMTALPIYAYDYKDDVQAAKQSGAPMPPKRVGPMAQDIEKVAPGAVGSVGGKKVVANLGFGGMR